MLSKSTKSNPVVFKNIQQQLLLYQCGKKTHKVPDKKRFRFWILFLNLFYLLDEGTRRFNFNTCV